MKSFICNDIEAVAFDLDGTLYDEYDFVRQAYRPVSKVLSLKAGLDEDKTYADLCRFWLLYGSSGNIFQLAFGQQKDCTMDDELLKQCVEAYRNADFDLELSQRTIDTLESLKDLRKAIISDGNSQLQRKKYRKLKLDQWIPEDDVFVSGDHGKKHYKPDPYMASLVKEKLGTEKILYFGDRDIDKEFAENAGLQFRLVKNMIVV